MSTGSTLILAVLAVIIMCVAVSAASKRPAVAWNYYHFDGRAFVAGPATDGSPFLAVRDHAVPVVLARMAKIEAVELPPAVGAVAGICYIQSSGGKLAGGSSYIPAPGITVTILSGGAVVVRTQTDGSGYFVALLPAGVYRISSGAFSAETTVEVGKTSLAALQTGKRMVD